jgi:hypothetical protein
MSKLNLKVDLSAPKTVELYFMGISSSTGIAVLANQLNRYLDINLSFYQKMIALHQEKVLDNLPIFTNYIPLKNELKVDEEIDFFDLRLTNEVETTKFLLMQTKGEKANLFPKINPMDFIFISNYPLSKFSEIIKSIPEITLHYELNMVHVKNQYKYFSDLFYN